MRRSREGGERLQLVAFFYGGERRGNALPLAVETPVPKAPMSPPTSRMPSRGLPAAGKASRAMTAVEHAASASKELKEAQRLVTLDDVRILAREGATEC